ncbi:MAG: hypothetical protein ABSF43_11325 [Rectinemataceae bacterium]|jgi:hypothetical protein
MRTTAPLVMLAFFIAARGAVSQTTAASGSAFLEPDPGFAEVGALAEPLDVSRMERAALLASGVRPERLAPYQSRLDRILGDIRSEAGQAADPAAATVAKAEAVLTFLHKNVLRSYREDATTIDGILDSGLFNCVSSAVIYALAARSLGIETAGVRTSDHAFCTVLAEGRSIDVETTNPYGFDPGGKKEFKDSFGRATGYAYVAPGGYGDRRAITAGDLVGLILYNRASMLERSGRFAEATRLGADYASLCPGPDSRNFIVDRVNNLVADFEGRRDYADAETVARAAAAALPGEARLVSLSKTTSCNRAIVLGQAGDWEAAFDAALRVVSADPSDSAGASLVATSLSSLAEDYARKGDFVLARRAVAERASGAGPAAAAAAYALVGDMELVKAANGRPFAEAAAAADRIRAAGEVSAARYAEAVGIIYGNEAERRGEARDWLGGALVAELGASKAPGDESLARLAQTLRHNFVIEAHNRFAQLYNSRDYSGAEAAIKAALAAMPDDASLREDLATAEKALARQ